MKSWFALLTCAAYATSATAQAFDNRSIMDLHQAGLGDATLVAKIRSMPCGYDVSVNGLVTLKNAGISDGIIATMVDRCTASARAQGVAVNSADPATAHPPGIYLLEDWLAPVQMTVVRPSKAGSLKITGNGSILFPFVGRLTVPDTESHATVSSHRPTFFFYFKPDDGKVSDFGSANSIAAQSPEEFSLIKFKIKDNGREVDIGKISVLNSRRGINPKDAISFQTEEMGDSVFKVTLSQDMNPGQYAFVLTGASGSSRIYDFGVR